MGGGRSDGDQGQERRAEAARAPASPDDELLIVVDEHDNVLAHRPKAEVHRGEGVLHRAFSVFLFDARGRLLLQQRSALKPLWPLYWSNSCCSHPRRGEADHEAAQRRVREELGLAAQLEFLFRFQYHARFEERGSERELCSVFVGRAQGVLRLDAGEVADFGWVAPDELDAALASQPERMTPWLKLEWPRMRAQHWAAISRHVRP